MMNTADIQKTHFYYVWGTLLALGAVIFAILLDSADSKNTAYGIIFALFGFVFLLYSANQKMLTNLAIVFLALGIPFNLDINLLYRKYTGVTSVDIGITLLSAAALFILFLYEYFTMKKTQSAFRSNRLLVCAVLLYIGSGFLSYYNAASRELVTLELIRMLMLFFIFYVVMNLRTNQQISLFIFSLSMGIVLQTMIAYYQYKTGRSLGLEAFGERGLARTGFEAIMRTSGTIGHPNILAYFFEMLIPLMVAMFLTETRKIMKLWYAVASIAGIIGIMTTLSRGGWTGLAAALVVVIVALYPPKLAYIKTYPALFAGIIIVIGLLFYIIPTVEKRLTSGDQGAAATRGPLNKAALSIIKQYPVTGVGLNNLAKVFRSYDTSGGSTKYKGFSHVVHNLYLIVWSETGTVGLITFLWIFLAAFIVAVKNYFKVTLWYKGILVGISAGLVAQLIHGFVDPGFKLLMNTSMLFYSLLGVIGAVCLLSKDEKEKAA